MAVFAGNDHGFQVVVDVIPRILVESILVGMIVAVWESIHPVSLANALGGIVAKKWEPGNLVPSRFSG